jgi:hypothetical protein
LEKLFDVGLWLDVNVGNVQTYTQSIGPVNPLGAYPYLVTVNGKVGYNIPLTHYFAMVPYLTAGKNANTTTLTAVVGGITDQVGISNDFFYTYGGGLRLERSMTLKYQKPLLEN